MLLVHIGEAVLVDLTEDRGEALRRLLGQGLSSCGLTGHVRVMAERGKVCIHLELGGAEPIRVRAERLW